MGVFDSKSKVKTTITTTNANFQDIGGPAVADVGGDVNLTLSDQGAIQAGSDAFADAVSFARDALQNSFTQSETVAGLAGDVLARESTNTDARFEGVTKIALIATAVVVVVVLFTR